MKTPQQSYHALAAAIGVPELYLKREDLHPYGSHKGRSIPLMIKTYMREGVVRFAISSSGNAALAAILAIKQQHKNNPGKKVGLDVYIGKKIAKEKRERLESEIGQSADIAIHSVDRPKQTAFQAEKNGKAKYLRQSTDDTALLGYASLAEELNSIPRLQAIFIPTSSGTTAQGLAHAFPQLLQHPEIHIVQTHSCHPIASALRTHAPLDAEPSIARAIVDRIAHRQKAVTACVISSGGQGWIVTNEEIRASVSLIKKTCGLTVSANSALGVAGLLRATRSGKQFSGSVACILTGP